MTLTLNGESIELRDPMCLLELIRQTGGNSERMAVLVDGQVVRASQFQQHQLRDGECVEMLTFVAGG